MKKPQWKDVRLPTFGTALIWVFALVQATRYGRMFLLNEAVQSGVTGVAAIDAVLEWFALFGGLLMGAGVSFGIAYVANKYRGLKAVNKTEKETISWTRLLLGGILFVSPFVLAPIAGAWVTWAWWRQVIAIAIPDGMVAALAFVDTKAESAKPTATQSDAGASQSAKVQLQVRRSAKQSAKSATESVALGRTYPRKCEHCEEVIRAPQSVGAHMKKHHPELCKPKGVVVTNLFEKVQA